MVRCRAHRRRLFGSSSSSSGTGNGTTDQSSSSTGGAEAIAAPLEALLSKKRVYTATYKRGAKPSVVILGSGWAGYQLARSLDKRQYKVTVVSDRNHFLFTPLLPSTTVRRLLTRHQSIASRLPVLIGRSADTTRDLF